MKVLIALTLALAPMRAHANGRLTRYARNSSYSTSHPGRCDRNVFEREFYLLAKGLEPTSDKVTAHSYETMYGTFVYPLKFAAHTPRVLEIGLGCNMDYGPGASVQIWRQLLPHAELWEAEYDDECVKKARAKGQLEGIKTVTGDQGDFAVLRRWSEEIGGELDVIIDDGGHKNSQIGHSFDVLWPLVRNGGVYVIEDLQVGRFKSYGGENINYEDTEGRGVMADKIKDWIEQLLTIPRAFKHTSGFKHKIPDDVSFVYCQLEACVIGKRNRHVEGSRPGLPGHDFPGRR